MPYGIRRFTNETLKIGKYPIAAFDFKSLKVL
jgi:hypothetical protein